MRNKTAARTSRTTSRRPAEVVSTRLVNESHWVQRNQLAIGMYVSELDKPWEETRFMFQGFRIDSQEVLEAVQDSCEYARVDTDKIARVSSNSSNRLVSAARRSLR